MTPPPLLLDRNENHYGPAPECYEALQGLTLHELSLYSREYTRGVKSRLSERLANELKIPEPQVLLSEGSEDMLKQAIHCYLGPGERVLCPDQSWWYYRTVASEVAGETITYQLKTDGHSYRYDVRDMIDLYQKHSPRVVLIASPNNPTGNSFLDEDLTRLTEAFRESIVILDEAYWGFKEQTNERIGELIGRYRNLLILRTFSKFYALAGARIGYAAAGASLTRLTKFASRYLGYNRISEELALSALNARRYYASINKNICDDRDRYYEFFDPLDGFVCFRSDANFVLVRFPNRFRQSLPNHFKSNSIAVKFFAEAGFEDCMRITIGTTAQNKRLRSSLKSFLSGQKGESRP